MHTRLHMHTCKHTSTAPSPQRTYTHTDRCRCCLQTCLPHNTSVSTPNSLCPYFLIFYQIFLCMHHQSIKTKMSTVNCSIIHLVRTVCEHTFSIIQTHYNRTTLFCLHLQKSFFIEERRTLSPKAMHAVCCFR